MVIKTHFSFILGALLSFRREARTSCAFLITTPCAACRIHDCQSWEKFSLTKFPISALCISQKSFSLVLPQYQENSVGRQLLKPMCFKIRFEEKNFDSDILCEGEGIVFCSSLLRCSSSVAAHAHNVCLALVTSFVHKRFPNTIQLSGRRFLA